MRRFLVKIQFNGRNYSGWQKQDNAATVQGEVDKALFHLFDQPIESHGCSRTDAGVSAEEFYFHFDADTKLPQERVAFKLNRFLPNEIQAQESKEVASSFHAREDVIEKTYCYSIYTSKHKLPLYSGTHVQVEEKLDVENMRDQAKVLLGKHDFSAFRSIGYEEGSESKSCVRTITGIRIEQENDKIKMYFTGDGFLYHMVRILAGTLIEVGKGYIPSLQKVLESKDRKLAGKTMPPKGLRLIQVKYKGENE